jgi:diaminopimelate epimerase
MDAVRFAKMSGAANDFVVIDNRHGMLSEVTLEWIQKICTPRFSVGADGVMLLGSSQDADFTMRYFNADGSEAAMCGNGGRCIARFAVLVGAGQEGRELSFTAPSGRYRALVQGDQVRLGLRTPEGLKLHVRVQTAQGERECDVLDTGVPHAVFYSDELEREDVFGVGREVRHHAQFQPAGTNVNFIQVVNPHELVIRTYERGVEGETWACGTGSAAAALCAAKRGLVQSPVKVITRSGMPLNVEFEMTADGFLNVFQTGEARLVFWGELSEEAVRFPVK